MANIGRLNCLIEDLSLDTATSTSSEVEYGPWICGSVLIPTAAGASITSLTWYACEQSGGTYLAAYDDAGVAVTQTVSHSKVYPIPVALAGCSWIMPVVNAAGIVQVNLKG